MPGVRYMTYCNDNNNNGIQHYCHQAPNTSPEHDYKFIPRYL